MREGRDVEHNERKINNLNSNPTATVVVLSFKVEENVMKKITSSADHLL